MSDRSSTIAVPCIVCRGKGTVEVSRLDILAGQDLNALAHEIVKETAKLHGVTAGDIVGPRRFARLAGPRNEVVRRLRDELGMTLKAIGFILGGRDHSTIFYSYARANGEPPRDRRVA